MKVRSALAKVGLINLIALGLLSFIEIWLRIAERPGENSYVPILMENPHKTGSYRLKPDLQLNTVVDGREIDIKTNSHGMSSAEIDVHKTKPRIAFVGDSFTFGCWADSFEATFVGRFAADVSYEGYEILNFGVPGYGFDDAELIIKEEVIRFQPDHVILMAFAGNDFRDTFLGLDQYTIENGVGLFDFENFAEKVSSEYHTDDTTKIGWFLSGHFATYRAFAKLRQSMGENNLSQEYLEVGRAFTDYSFWSQVAYPEVAMQTIDISLKTLGRIEQFLRENEVTFQIAAIPYKEQVYVVHPMGNGYDIRFPQKYIAEYAETHGVPYLDLLPPLRESFRKNNEALYAKRDPHLNNNGHRVIGEVLSQWFTEIGSPNRASVDDTHQHHP